MATLYIRLWNGFHCVYVWVYFVAQPHLYIRNPAISFWFLSHYFNNIIAQTVGHKSRSTLFITFSHLHPPYVHLLVKVGKEERRSVDATCRYTSVEAQVLQTLPQAFWCSEPSNGIILCNIITIKGEEIKCLHELHYMLLSRFVDLEQSNSHGSTSN